jgi:FAD/FMN-containing dehydrogenase/Fe-S oxidoreductase
MSIALPVLPASATAGRIAQEAPAALEARRVAIAEGLRARVRGEVRFGRHDRLLYATDASIYQVEPIGVVVPRDVADAQAVIRYCAEESLPVLPRGGGTALAGQTVNLAVVIDFSAHCRGILTLDPGTRRASVEPGVVLDQLNAAAAAHGLMFGPDVATSSHATLGGMIGNNSAGAWSIRYGRTVEHLRAVDVLLADGRALRFDEGAVLRDRAIAGITEQVAAIVLPLREEIRRRYPRIRRHVDGYNLDLILDQLERGCDGGSAVVGLAQVNLAHVNLAQVDLAHVNLAHVNLAHLICGSEGTLATVVGAELDLVHKPRARGLAIVGFASVDEALSTLQSILATGPAAVELVDDVVLSMATANREYRRYVEIMPQPANGPLGAVLYVEYADDSKDAILASLAALRGLLPGPAIAVHTDAAAMAAAWKLRKAGEPLLHGVPGLRKPITFVEDTAVDPRRLPEFVREFRSIVARHGTIAAYYAHASVGCLHIRPLIHLRDEADLRTMEAIASEVAELVVRYEGALSGEHGDGRVRSPFLERYFGRPLCEAFRRIKSIFDPEGRMNPGNIVAPESMDARLRVRPGSTRDGRSGGFVAVSEEPTRFSYEREHGFGQAVEMCNGAGICRRLTPGGTMCPSYRALLDERHATRGRGNALRLAITGQLSGSSGESPTEPPQGRWSDPETLETLRLCLSCKACKTECPSNVDISKLKAEYLARHWESQGGAPLAVRVLGDVRRLNRLAAALPTLTNALGASPMGRWMTRRLLGFAHGRTLPRVERSLRASPRARRSAHPVGTPTVILYPDCFTLYNDPRIGLASIEALEAFGYRVILPPAAGDAVGCCGRAQISLGLLDRASRTICRSAKALLELVSRERAVAVVGCEPSCISALRDDWLELNLPASEGAPSRSSLQDLAARTFLVEEFLERRWADHPRTPALPEPRQSSAESLTTAGGPILLHGHCHQKALWGVESSAALLQRLVGGRLSIIDSGCCGMAGSFGYMADRYHLSMAIGEQSLFPAVRAAPGDAVICAPGTSCRHQLHDGTGRHALHPMELVAALLNGG